MRQAARRLVILTLRLSVMAVTGLAALAFQEPAKPEPPPAQLERSILPAAGLQKTLLNVTRFGRYSILAASRQGTALQLIDRMAGPGGIEGTAGEQDGRLDAFLERGQYQIAAHGHRNAAGTVRLELRPFVERNLPRPPQLIESKLIEEQLQDFEQLSYWLEIKRRQFVALEAAGRSLADLRLWKDGNWLVDAHPATRVIYPKEGQPLFSCRLNVELDPGLYLVTAYGGPSQPWAEESTSHPFYLRRGIPRLSTAGRKRFVVSPFGQDRYLAPGSTTCFRMELPEASTARLQVDGFNHAYPFEASGSTSEISKKSVPPTAEVSVQRRDKEDHIVTITAESGRPYVLQHFEAKSLHHFEGAGEHWISTIHSGFVEDSVDATAVLVSRLKTPLSRPELAQARTVEIGSREYWHRRTNLLGPTTLFVHVKDTGIYQLACQGVEAQYRVEPFFVDRPPNYQPPIPRPCGANWNLDAGYHVLTIAPFREGVADLLMRPMGLLDTILETAGWTKSLPITPSRGTARFPRVTLSRDRSYSLYLNTQPEVKAGVILRSLPVDLTDPLYIVQEPGQMVSVPFQVEEPGTVRAEAEDGSLLEISIDGGQWQTTIPVDTAAHTISVRHSLRRAAQYNLAVVPRSLDSQTPLPSVSQEALAAVPEFPILDESAPQFGDLEARQTATYLLEAERPALYRLQSTGLLATAGNLRSRTNPSFVRKSQNGVGRNFSLQQFLREGDYQVSVQAEGESAGHYGLELARTAVRNGGFLTSRIPARATLEPGQAIAYYFKITNPGEFRVRALGEGRTFRCRLEDENGWPVVPPDVKADISRYFPPGQYRMVILPQVTTSRVVAQIEPTPRKRRYKGHGPHTLRLDERIDHIWMEPEGDGVRTPDRWDFTSPAPLKVRIDLSNEMQGNLLRLDDSGEAVRLSTVMPGRHLDIALAMGRYRLEVVALRRNNRAPYRVAVLPAELVTGLSRDVRAPASIPLSVGQTGLVEISSFGSDDVQAELFDSQGKPVAANDDRPDDWNFLISRMLTPGRYRLDVKPSGKAEAGTTISMLTPAEEPQKVLSLPARLKPILRRAVRLYPLPPLASPALLAAAVDSNENVGLAVEALQDGVWHVLASRSDKSPVICMPLGATGAAGRVAHRLRVWSLDRREMRIGLRVEFITPVAATEAQLQSGIEIRPSPDPNSFSPAVMVKLDRPGLFQVDDGPGICWSTGFGEPCEPAAGRPVAAWNDELWIAAASPELSAAPSVRARRLVLSPVSAVPIQFAMRDQDRIHCDLASNGEKPILVLASSQGAQPAIQLVERNRRPAPSLNNVAVARRGSASVLLGTREPAAAVWAGTPESAGLDVRISPYYFPAVEPVALAGIADGRLEGISASAYAVGSGPKRLHIALGDATVAVLSKGDEIESVHWQGGNPFNITVESAADRLTLLHTRQEEDRFAVEAIPLRAEELLARLTIAAPYEQDHLRSGIRRLAVPASPGEGNQPVALHVRGAVESVTFLGSDGRILRGSDFVVPSGGGTLEIAYRSGFLLCWLDRPGHEAQGLWPAAPDLARAEVISLPATRRLRNAAEAFRIRTETPVLLRVRMAAPSVTLLRRGSELPEVEVHPDYTLLEGYLPAGMSQFCLRSIGRGLLSNSVELTAGPVTSIGEGLGPEVLLAPGDSRLFSFEVKQAGPVGIGVRASSDVIESELLSGNGRSLGKGTVQKMDLQPGIYLLALRAPASGSPIRARPAVVGIAPPGTGPPEEVIRKYLDPEAAPPQFTSRRQEGAVEAEEYGEEYYPEGTIEDVGYVGEGE